MTRVTRIRYGIRMRMRRNAREDLELHYTTPVDFNTDLFTECENLPGNSLELIEVGM